MGRINYGSNIIGVEDRLVCRGQLQTTTAGFDKERGRSMRTLREFQARNGFRIVDNQGHRFTIDRIQRYSKIPLIETSA